tara:strand:+ start:1054 stop:1215 length:162 start_codon:yes stop_codon:yes gene_type:complete
MKAEPIVVELTLTEVLDILVAIGVSDHHKADNINGNLRRKLILKLRKYEENVT